MTPKQEAALRQALEALDGLYLPGELERVNKAIIALREALAAVAEPHKQSAPATELRKQQESVAWGEFVETACALIKAADDAAADRDYMLDSDDCIKVLRGTWSAPLANDQPSPPSSKPLTDEQRQYVVQMWRGGNWTAGDIIDAVEAAHGIKGDA